MLFDYDGAKEDIERIAPGEGWLLDIYLLDRKGRDAFLRSYGMIPRDYGSTVDQDGGKDGCYVATCVYGSYDCPEVRLLRRFRDDRLRCSAPGRAFIRFYYRVSPGLVRRFGKYRVFRKICKAPIDALVRRLERREAERARG